MKQKERGEKTSIWLFSPHSFQQGLLDNVTLSRYIRHV